MRPSARQKPVGTLLEYRIRIRLYCQVYGVVWYGVYGMEFYLTQMFLSWTPMEAKVSRTTEQWKKKEQ